jgi:hypothetical protein
MIPSQPCTNASFHPFTRESEGGTISKHEQHVDDRRELHLDQIGNDSAHATGIFGLWKHFLTGPRADEVN